MDICPYCRVAVDVGIRGEKQIYLCRNPQCARFGTPLAAVAEELTGSMVNGTVENGPDVNGALVEANAAAGGQAQKNAEERNAEHERL